MARARNIKPGFFKNEDLAECSLAARLCFAGLWTLADREGRLEDRPKRIKGELFPFDSIEVEPLLADLTRWKFIDRYEVDGFAVIQVLEFKKHQTPHFKEVPSALPERQSPGLTPHSMNAKPETESPFNEDETRDGLVPNPHSTGGEPPGSKGGQPPLNPESGFLNPDSPSLNPESGVKRAPQLSAREAVPGDSTPTPTPAGAACMAMKAVGLPGVNPSHPDLLRLLAAGVTPQELADCAVEAVSTGKRTPFFWVLATVEGRRNDAAQRGAVPPAGTRPPSRGGYAAERNRAFAGEFADDAHLTLDEEKPNGIALPATRR